MKHNGKNIITDQDITLTGEGYSGQNLCDTLTDHEDRLDRVESNVKWIYRNGRVGTGSGGGSGSGSISGKWTVVLTRTDTGAVLKDGAMMNLSGAGKYGFSIQIYRGGADTFSVSYSYQNSKGNMSAVDTLNSTNSFFVSRSFELDINGTLTIKISNKSEPDEQPLTYSIDYITSSYSFNLSYVYADNHSPFTLNTDNTIFMNDVKGRGIMAALNYSVAVRLQAVSYTYTDWEGNTRTVSSGDNAIKEKSSGTIYLPLCSNILEYLSNDENAKYRQFTLDIDMVIDGQIEKEGIEQLSLKDNLIPSNLFLRVTASGGTIYDTQQERYPESGQFIVGTIVFQVTPFYGPIVVGRTYNFSVFLDDVQLGEEEGIRITALSDQMMQSIPVPVADAREHKVSFVITEPTSGKTYSADYWFTAREATSSFTYYPKRSLSTGTVDVVPETTDVYRRLQTATNIEGLTPMSSISMTSVAGRTITYNLQSEQRQSYDNLDQMICLGIQYVRTNDVSGPIAKFSISGGPQGDIYIYQNKILICSDSIVSGDTINGDSCEIYLPMCKTLGDAYPDDYHLLTIYKRLEKKEGNNAWKGVYVYIDGVLEGAFASFVSAPHNKYESVTFYPGNYYVNLIESSSFSHSGEDLYESYLYDIDIQGYYYAYRELILGRQIGENVKNLYDNFKTFYADEENFIKTDQTAIYNIARYSEAPVLIMNFTDQGNGINGIKGANRDCFKEYMSVSYNENDEPERASVTVEYSPGYAEPTTILKNGIVASFSVEPQGSSTKSYRCKNWELYAPSPSDEDNICVYTPNFKLDDYSTFLPEESFTLKADVVDSSHTNNNAVGAFVNDVTTPFQAAINAQRSTSGERSRYAGYVKNCLTGFPILVFLHTNYKSDENEQELSVHNYYFLGVYNFNLGRKSYFNLGYKNTGALERINIEEGFGIYELPKSQTALIRDMVVAEVQGNNDYFDFSQYSTSVLFKKEEGNDTTYMWGDFVNGSGSEAVSRTAIANFVKKVSNAGGFIFDTIGKNFSFSADDNYGYYTGYSAVDENGVPKNQVPNYRAQVERRVVGAENIYDFSLSSDDATINDLRDFVITNEEDESKARGIDYASLVEYYTICMAFGLVDSVEKNLNIKSWTGGKEFYLAFYDMDTCLGVSNSGSKISYFAFSDYWDWKNSISSGDFESVKIYRDYAPKVEGSEINSASFYDIPSSYLFAIAKYAYFVLLANSTSAEQVSTLSQHPNNLWALWRRSDGCLANAQTFIDRYYKHHLASIPEVALNYNYRYKYFVRSAGNGFDSINFPKFYGRKIAYTETWLDNRLHILDAYFNINSINDLLTSRVSAPMVTNNDVVDTNNQDIYVLHDVFSTNSVGSQYANVNAPITAKAKAYAPMIIKTPNSTSRYMFPDDEDQECGFTVRTSGNQTVLFGGSALWTEVSSINPFITGTNSFSITSDYFSNIIGTGGSVCNSWTFNTPSLKSLTLTNNEDKTYYSGNIIFDGVENFPNLSTVKIDGTAINLTISNSNVSVVSALGMKSGSRLSITNTPNISDIRISGSVGDLSLPGWGTDIRIPFDSTEINSRNITVQNTKYPGASITISNAPNLETLVLSGFAKVVVSHGCPRLKKIIISDVEDQENFGLRVLDIRMTIVQDVDKPEHFTFNDDVDYIDLSGCEYLEAVRIQDFETITKVDLPDHDVKLLPSAFSGCKELSYLGGAGKRIILSSDDDSDSIASGPSETFKDCYEFRMRQYDSGPLVDLYVSPNNKNLNGTFFINTDARQGMIDFEAAKYFLETSCRDAEGVKTCENLFRNQRIAYYKNMFASEYAQGKCSLSLKNLPALTDVSGVFRGCPVDAISRYMFEGLSLKSIRVPVTEKSFFAGSRANEIVYNPTTGANEGTDRVIYITRDVFAEIIDTIEVIQLLDQQEPMKLCVLDIDSSGNSEIAIDINLADIFNPSGIAPQKLYDIQNIEFYAGHRINFRNTFTSSWGAADDRNIALRLSYFMYQGSYRFFSDNTTLEGLLKDVRLGNINFCFNNFQAYPGSVDIEQFIDWDKIGSCTSLFYHPGGNYSLGMSKHCSYEGFHRIWNKILTKFDFTKSTSSSGIGSIFSGCSIISANEIPALTLTDSDITCDSCTNISFMFVGLNHKRSLSDSDTLPLHITSDFLKPLPALRTLRYTFTNTKWANPVPFNFFRKQTAVETQTVYVERGGERVEATYTKFRYKKELTDITGCFSNTTLESNVCYDPAASYNTGVTRMTIVDDEDNEYTEYYETLESNTKQHLYDPGYSDCFGFTCAVPSATINFGSETDDEWTNPTQASGSMRDGVFCAPDVFYGVADGGTIDSAFDVSGVSKQTPVFSGALPKHLVSGLATTTSLSNVLSGLNIWPIKYGEVQDPDDPRLTHTYYYFVPEEFTYRPNLSRAFNFKLILPDKRVQLGGGYAERPHYYILLNTSLPQTVMSLDNALPNVSPIEVKRTWPGYGTLEGSYYSIMGTPRIISGQFDGFDSGIDYDRLYSLKFDNIVGTGLAAVISGKFVKDVMLWNKNNCLASPSNYAILLGISGLSTNATMDLPKGNNGFLAATANCEVSKSSITNWSDIEATIDPQTGKPRGYSSINFVDYPASGGEESETP